MFFKLIVWSVKNKAISEARDTCMDRGKFRSKRDTCMERVMCVVVNVRVNPFSCFGNCLRTNTSFMSTWNPTNFGDHVPSLFLNFPLSYWTNFIPLKAHHL